MSQNLKLKMALMGGADGGFTPPPPAGFITITDGPNVVLLNHSTTDVSCTATTTDLTPTDVDHYFGIWLATANPIDDEVKAGTNAIQSASSLSVASGVEVTHSFAAVTADVAYKLHWLCEHPEESKRTRGTAVEFTLANAPPQGKPTITGIPEVGRTLTGDASNVTDEDGLGPFSHQWYREGVAISGATSTTYTTIQADTNNTLTYAVSYIDGAGKLEGPVHSDPTWVILDSYEYLHNFDTATDGGFTHARASDATMHDYVGTIVTLTEPDPAFVGSQYTSPDTYVDHGVGYGIQLENDTTNDTTPSSEVLESWYKINTTTVDANGPISELGTASSTITVSAGGGTKYLSPLNWTTTGDDVCTYCLAPGTVEWVQLLRTGDNAWQNVNLTTGALGQGALFASTTVRKTSTTFIEITTHRAGGNAGNTVRIYPIPSDLNFNTAWTADGSETIHFAWAQNEPGKTTRSSYIPALNNTPVTRAATNLSAPFSALPPLPAGGVVNDYCAQLIFRLKQDFSTIPNYRRFAAISKDANNQNQIRLLKDTGTNFNVNVIAGGVTTNHLHTYSGVAGDILDVRLKKSSTEGWVSWVNGVRMVTGTNTGPHTVDMDIVRVGQSEFDDGSGVNLEHIRTRILPYALDDTAIEAWESWTEPLPIITQQPTDINFGGDTPPLGDVNDQTVSIAWVPGWENDNDSTGGTNAVFTAPEGSTYVWQAESGHGTNVWVAAGTVLTATGTSTQTMTVDPATSGEMRRVRCMVDDVPTNPAYLSIFEEDISGRTSELTASIGSLLFFTNFDYAYYEWDRYTDYFQSNQVKSHYGTATTLDAPQHFIWRKEASKCATSRAAFIKQGENAGKLSHTVGASESFSAGLTLVFVEQPHYANATGTSAAVRTSTNVNKVRVGRVGTNYGVGIDGGSLVDTGIAVIPNDANIVAVTVNADNSILFSHVDMDQTSWQSFSVGTSSYSGDVAEISFLNDPVSNNDPSQSFLGCVAGFDKALNSVELGHVMRTMRYRMRRGYNGNRLKDSYKRE